jgi:hypothetical protein
MVTVVVTVEVGVWETPEVRELATEGSSPKPGFVRLRSSCMAAAAACLVALSSSSDWAGRGDPEFFDHTLSTGFTVKILWVWVTEWDEG